MVILSPTLAHLYMKSYRPFSSACGCGSCSSKTSERWRKRNKTASFLWDNRNENQLSSEVLQTHILFPKKEKSARWIEEADSVRIRSSIQIHWWYLDLFFSISALTRQLKRIGGNPALFHEFTDSFHETHPNTRLLGSGSR